jgi:hypothetical protein
MAASRESEENVYQVAKAGLKRWLTRARDAVMRPFRNFGALPDPEAVYSTQPYWNDQVALIMEALDPVSRQGWIAADLPGPYNPDDAYLRAALAMTHNLIVRIPDEAHAKIVAIIFDGTNKGQSTDVIARRIDDYLVFEGHENWDGRARLIAQTETTRNFSAGMIAHGLLAERAGARVAKKWMAHDDNRTRISHVRADGQVRRMDEMFEVTGEDGTTVQMLYPGDPTAPADEVCNCRCWPKVVRLP